ncbi:hypothetical protein [Bacillus solitudinis]|nr:hypothetical protein [Bacillus solitudinis]
MTVSEKKMIDAMQKKIEKLTVELNELKKVNHNGFEKDETNDFLIQVYN